ncbi:hypothetical protein C0J52_20648 [Blattella germanica]|nr:hypothetical protein C0J52_20648 [Blattella germanica]
MATEIMKSFGALQAELERAKDNLKGVDENIRKLIGRDPSEGQQRLSGPPRLKREGDSGDEEDVANKPAISSRVIATPKELPSRQEAMAAQSTDERSKARNRRMFGALLGTLQKFRQEETRMRDKEEKRAKVEKKLEENAKREKEELKKERQELFQERKRKQAEIKKIELKLLRMKEQEEWEKMIEKKRQELLSELEAIEKRGRWRQGLGDSEGGIGQVGNNDLQGDMEMMEVGDDEHRLEVNEDSDKIVMQEGKGPAFPCNP